VRQQTRRFRWIRLRLALPAHSGMMESPMRFGTNYSRICSPQRGKSEITSLYSKTSAMPRKPLIISRAYQKTTQILTMVPRDYKSNAVWRA
jgi:hypothetical protein